MSEFNPPSDTGGPIVGWSGIDQRIIPPAGLQEILAPRGISL